MPHRTLLHGAGITPETLAGFSQPPRPAFLWLNLPAPGDFSPQALSEHIRAQESFEMVRFVSGRPPQIHVIPVTNTGAPLLI